MRRRSCSFAALLLAVPAWSCGGEALPPGEGGSESTVWEEPAWQGPEGWHLEAEPHVEISGADDRAFLTRVSDAWVSRDRVVVGNLNSPPAIRVYDLNGELEWQVEGEGDGPGEFRGVGQVWSWPAGKITAYDPWGGRFTTFDWAGQTPEVTRLDWFPGSGMIAVSLQGPVNDSILIGRPNVGGLPEGVQEGRVMEPLYRLNMRAGTWDTLAVVPRWDLFTDSEGRPGLPIFGRRTAIAAGPDRVVWGIGDEYTLHDLGISGQEVVFGREHEPRPVTSALADSLLHRRLAALTGPEADAMRPGVERWFRDAPRAETLPAFDRILLDPSQNVWVRNYLAPGDLFEVWSVFDADRRWLGEVEMPPGLQVRDISDEWVTGVFEDELGVPHVLVYRLVRS